MYYLCLSTSQQPSHLVPLDLVVKVALNTSSQWRCLICSYRRGVSPSSHRSSILFLSFAFPSPPLLLLISSVGSSFLTIRIPSGSVPGYLLYSPYTRYSHGFESAHMFVNGINVKILPKSLIYKPKAYISTTR